MGEEEESKEEPTKISDETIIGGTSWNVLKTKAMQDDYDKQEWFKQLDEDEKDQVDILREVQKEQGDMQALEPFILEEEYDA